MYGNASGVLLYCPCVIAKGGMASRLEGRIEISYLKGAMLMYVWKLLDLVVKILPYVIKLAGLIAKKAKDKRRPQQQRTSDV